jgi:hypothetical protein
MVICNYIHVVKSFLKRGFYMAKVKGPLMSMDARGQLGKTLVFLGWKGLKTVRSHVIPANPRSDGQIAQRDIMKAAVAAFHAVAYVMLDGMAFNVLASLASSVMSGFNIFCKNFITQTLLDKTIGQPYGFAVDTNTGGVLAFHFALPGVVNGYVRYGSSPSVMGTILALTHAGEGQPYTASLNGLTPGQYLYLNFYTEAEGNYWLTGIYKVLLLA